MPTKVAKRGVNDADTEVTKVKEDIEKPVESCQNPGNILHNACPALLAPIPQIPIQVEDSKLMKEIYPE